MTKITYLFSLYSVCVSTRIKTENAQIIPPMKIKVSMSVALLVKSIKKKKQIGIKRIGMVWLYTNRIRRGGGIILSFLSFQTKHRQLVPSFPVPPTRDISRIESNRSLRHACYSFALCVIKQNKETNYQRERASKSIKRGMGCNRLLTQEHDFQSSRTREKERKKKKKENENYNR